MEKGRAKGAEGCLFEAPFCAAVSMATVPSATPYRRFERSREIFAALVCDVTSGLRNESTVLHMIRAAPLETGVLQRDSRVWLHPKRRLACPLGRLLMKPNGARRRRRMDVPRRGTLLRSGQYDNCAKRHSVSSTEAKPWALYLTRIRVNAQEEKRKHGITCHTSSPLEKGRAEGAG